MVSDNSVMLNTLSISRFKLSKKINIKKPKNNEFRHKIIHNRSSSSLCYGYPGINIEITYLDICGDLSTKKIYNVLSIKRKKSNIIDEVIEIEALCFLPGGIKYKIMRVDVVDIVKF